VRAGRDGGITGEPRIFHGLVGRCEGHCLEIVVREHQRPVGPRRSTLDRFRGAEVQLLAALFPEPGVDDVPQSFVPERVSIAVRHSANRAFFDALEEEIVYVARAHLRVRRQRGAVEALTEHRGELEQLSRRAAQTVNAATDEILWCCGHFRVDAVGIDPMYRFGDEKGSAAAGAENVRSAK
jgi:hypothetical protein